MDIGVIIGWDSAYKGTKQGSLAYCLMIALRNTSLYYVNSMRL